jgi:two-component system phosphate regulon sensor histidine kinase PhoR
MNARKVYPLIVVLITLSVVGILFIQMSWINNAIKLKHEEFQRSVDEVLKQSREVIFSKYLSKHYTYIPDEGSRRFYLSTHFSVDGTFNKDEIKEIIRKELKNNNIKQPFEFSIVNMFKSVILQSDNFNPADMATATRMELAPEDSYRARETLFLAIREDKNLIIREMGWMIVASIVFTTIIVLAFAITVRTLFNQKKLSEIKSDFINNMTHELKTPLATISLAIDALTNEKVIHDTDKIKIYSSMIKEENKRMNKQVEKILQAARLEKEEIKLTLQQLDTHQIIRKVADNMALQMQEKNGRIDLRLGAGDPNIEADEVHFSNIIFNLLDNAMKYSSQSPEIIVETLKHGNGMLTIRVKDNGIGMDRETQARIFEKFYRAHTGNIHNVKGFGLGLSYVKAIVEAHDGRIKVESAPGKGSTFTITLPGSR